MRARGDRDARTRTGPANPDPNPYQEEHPLTVTLNPSDPLGISELLEARRDWDARYPTSTGDTDADILPIEREALVAMYGKVFEEHRPAPPADQPAEDNPPATTAGEEDHTNPWSHAGEPADAPEDTGQPPADDDPDTEAGDDQADEEPGGDA